MKAKLNQLAYLKVLTVSKDSPFFDQLRKERSTAHFHERLVYSYLGYRDRIGKPATVRRIADDTGLSPRTVEKTLASLGALVVCDKTTTHKKWSPVAPPEGWFGLLPDPDGDHWFDTYRYVKCFVPRNGAKIKYKAKSKRFGLFHSAVYSQVVSLAKRNSSVITTETGLSTMLNGVTRRTIGTILNDLDHLGLLSREKVGDRLRVQLLPITDVHLELFRPLPKGEKIKVSPPKPPADPNNYDFRGDSYDEWRKVCMGLMAQSYAEKSIEMSVELCESFDGFREFVLDTKTWHEQNKLNGRVTKGHLGRFLVQRYRGRIKEYRRRAAEAKAAEERHRYLNSDEYRAKVEAEQAEAAADPLHKKHAFSVDSVTARVRFDDSLLTNARLANDLISRFERHVCKYVADEFDPRDFRMAAGKISRMILQHALFRVNQHYVEDTWASPEEFVNAVNDAIRSIKDRSMPEFQWTIGEQHA